MTDIGEIEQLRTHLASEQLRAAFSHYKSGNIDGARKNLKEAIRLDPKLPNPYVILSKIAFWEGDLTDALANLAYAEERGLSDSQCQRMRNAIDEVQKRADVKQRSRAESTARRKAMWSTVYRVATNDANWLSEQRIALFLFLICMLLLFRMKIS